MLRITPITDQDSTVTLKLEGAIVAGWVETLQTEYQRWTDRGKAIILDFADVTYIDGAGVTITRELLAGNAILTRCSDLILGMLHPDRPL